MAGKIEGLKVAILATEGFEQSELLEPKEALEDAGATARVVSPTPDEIRGWKKDDWGKKVDVDVALESADPAEFDALLLPGGVMNPDKLRMDPRAVAFVKSFVDSGKPIAAICHGPWTLIEAGAARGRRLTSWPSLKTDLRNAGADWVDEEVVVDRGIVTSRKPADIPAFNRKMIEEFAEGRHARAGSAEPAFTRA
ncbi:MAG TPA: type 1 glutamine amidotransferase domain-containing protein [Thermoanaerobaculia bacterium]|nr:type 1 glutamine amidotransferase domain-containing protein [Thermoanaerobaculia bacterium]